MTETKWVCTRCDESQCDFIVHDEIRNFKPRGCPLGISNLAFWVKVDR